MVLVGLSDVVDRIDQISPTLSNLLIRGTKKLVIRMQAHIRLNHLSGQTLSRRRGQLSQAIREKVIDEKEKGFIEGRVFVGREAFYGAFHEKGGTFLVPAHFRQMTEVFGRRLNTPKQVLVRAHFITFPKRPFLAPTLKKFKPTFRNMVKAAMAEAMKPEGAA